MNTLGTASPMFQQTVAQPGSVFAQPNQPVLGGIQNSFGFPGAGLASPPPAFGSVNGIVPVPTTPIMPLSPLKAPDAPLLELSSKELSDLLMSKIRDEWALKIVRAVLDSAVSQGVTQISQLTDHVISQLLLMARVSSGSTPISSVAGVSPFLASQPGLLATPPAKPAGRRASPGSAKKAGPDTPICQYLVKKKDGSHHMCGSAAVEAGRFMMCSKHCNVKNAAVQLSTLSAEGGQIMTKAAFDARYGVAGQNVSPAAFKAQGGIAPQPVEEDKFTLIPLSGTDMFISSGELSGIILTRSEGQTKFDLLGVGYIVTTPVGGLEFHVSPLLDSYRAKLESAHHLKDVLNLPAVNDPNLVANLEMIKQKIVKFIDETNVLASTNPEFKESLNSIVNILSVTGTKLMKIQMQQSQGLLQNPPQQVQPQGFLQTQPHGLLQNPPQQVQPQGLLQNQPQQVQPHGLLQNPPQQVQPHGLLQNPPQQVTAQPNTLGTTTLLQTKQVQNIGSGPQDPVKIPGLNPLGSGPHNSGGLLTANPLGSGSAVGTTLLGSSGRGSLSTEIPTLGTINSPASSLLGLNPIGVNPSNQVVEDYEEDDDADGENGNSEDNN